MVLRLFVAAFAAGVIAGLGVTALQQLTTTPLIHAAESFEAKAAERKGHAETDSAPWAPKDGLERAGYTALANVILGTGFALLLVGCFALHGRPMTGQAGALWGLAGFAVFTLGPAAGLPPELPGMTGSELSSRQAWWLLAACCTAGGLWLLVLKRPIAAKIAGATLLLAPVAIGAPHPGASTSLVPPELASRFAATTIVVSAVFWATLGWLSGTFHARFARLQARPPRGASAA